MATDEQDQPKGPQPFMLSFVAAPVEGGYELRFLGGGMQITIASGFEDQQAVFEYLMGAFNALFDQVPKIQDIENSIGDLGGQVAGMTDTIAQHDQNFETMDGRLYNVEAGVQSLQRAFPRPTAPRPDPRQAGRPRPGGAPTAYRVGQRLPVQEPLEPEQTAYVDTEVERPRRAPRIVPSPGHPVAAAPAHLDAIQYEGTRPEFDRGTVEPHVPIGGVTRGPGSPRRGPASGGQG